MEYLKTVVLMLSSLISGMFADKAEMNAISPTDISKGSLYEFKMVPLEGGNPVDLSTYKGKKVVILNTASKCGFTKQYADWEAFYKQHGDKIVVLGFPANNFGGQEPGTNEEIAEFCQ